MLFLTLWLLVLISERSIASKHRSVNIALETILQFDKADDINVLHKVQDFLSHIQSLLDKKGQVSDNVPTRRKKRYLFTDFVEELVTALNSFEDKDLKQVFRIVDKYLRTQRVNNDLVDDNVRRFLSIKLTEMINKPAMNIRRDLDRILKELRADKNSKRINVLDFINSLYKQNSERNLSKLIKRLNLFLRSARKSKVVLKSIIEKVINDVIYKHYNNLENSEKDYIKRFVKAYFIHGIPTGKGLEIKQRAKETEITQESINTNKSKSIKQVTEFQWTPKTSKDVPKKLFTHITLYPKSIKVKKIPKSFPIIESTPTNDENISDKGSKNTRETREVLANQSVEINVNLLLDHSLDSQNREESETVESLRAKSTKNKIILRAFQKSSKNKKYHISSTPALSKETFGSLYRSKTPKRYDNKKKSRLVTYNGKTTMKLESIIYDGKTTNKDRYFKSTNVDDIGKEKDVPEKTLNKDRRRFNKPTNLTEKKFPEYDIKDIITTTQPSLTTEALVSLITSTNKVTTPVVATDKSTTKTTPNFVSNEIFGNENVAYFKDDKSLVERIQTTTEFVPKNNTTQFENDSNHQTLNETTVTEESTTAFDLNNYIKNSEVLSLEDEEKKKTIEEKMRADFQNLLASSTNVTTEGITDIFKELEDAFQI